MINAHSHAWHRGLRDVTDGPQLDEGKKSFWGWRDAMYNLASKLAAEPSELYKVCRVAFEEMLASGITTVGEFHYLHHSKPRDEAAKGTQGLYDLDKVVLGAAKDVGIRIVFLQTYYDQAGLRGESLNQTQQHFNVADMAEFVSQLDGLAQEIEGDSTQHLGVAAHSVRGTRLENIVNLHKESLARNIPFHIHLEEQPKEIEDCLAKYNQTPSELLLANLTSNNDEDDKFGNLTCVHCTHTTQENLDAMLNNAGSVCITPLTEGRLGDGVFSNWPRGSEFPGISLGTDCNNRICFFEEMRWALYCQQMKHVRRGFANRQPHESALLAFQMATKNGAKSLGLQRNAGALSAGCYADMFSVDLTHRTIKNAGPHSLLDALIFGSSADAVVKNVWVGGRLVKGNLE